jgi:phage terminase large subunit
VLIDQVEEIDPGDDGERLWDTVLGRLSDPRGPRKALLVANPAGLTSWQYRRLVDESSRDSFVRRVHFTLRDNAANLPADYVAAMEATKETRPAWFKGFILGEWGSFEGAAYESFSEELHVVAPFEVPSHWGRFESMDHGAANPTAWHSWAVDEDGNLVVAGEHYRASSSRGMRPRSCGSERAGTATVRRRQPFTATRARVRSPASRTSGGRRRPSWTSTASTGSR